MEVHLSGAWHPFGHVHVGSSSKEKNDGQTKRVFRIIEDIPRSVCAYAPRRWRSIPLVVEFSLNKFVHASTDYTPFYVNGL